MGTVVRGGSTEFILVKIRVQVFFRLRLGVFKPPGLKKNSLSLVSDLNA